MDFKLASWEIESDENSQCLIVFHTNGKLYNCLFMPYLSVFFVSQENLILLDLINRYDFNKSVTFEKQRHFGTLQSKFFILANH